MHTAVRTMGQIKCRFFVIGDQKQARHAKIDLLAGAPMRVWMKPITAGPVHDLEFVDVTFPRRNRKARMAIHLLGNVQPVPVNDCRFGQPIDQINAHTLTLAHANDWSRVSIGRPLKRTSGTA